MTGALEQTPNMPSIVLKVAQGEVMGARYFMAVKTANTQEELVNATRKSDRW